jgi:hypothetical protein
LAIVAYFLQVQAAKLNNAARSLGGSKFGRRKIKESKRMEDHTMLHANYFDGDAGLYLKGVSAPD